MQWLVVDVIAAAGLDDPAEIHHRDPLAEIADHGEVVADEEEGQIVALPQRGEQIA